MMILLTLTQYKVAGRIMGDDDVLRDRAIPLIRILPIGSHRLVRHRTLKVTIPNQDLEIETILANEPDRAIRSMRNLPIGNLRSVRLRTCMDTLLREADDELDRATPLMRNFQTIDPMDNANSHLNEEAPEVTVSHPSFPICCPRAAK